MRRRTLIGWLLVLLVVPGPGLNGLSLARIVGQPPPLAGVCSESDRFGVWHPRADIKRFDVGQLHIGWYTTHRVGTDLAPPAGLRLVQLVRLSDDGPFPEKACYECPTWDQVRTIAQESPGSLWMIGNEPDRQDYVGAARYAELYHDFYGFLKAEDPGCQVAIGGVVQPTPIRLQYLDLILDAYEAQYGEPMPVDVWNVHNYVLREGVTGWGCGIPPGTDPALAIEYDIQDHDRLAYWAGHLIAMRTWMEARGYRDRPLVVSEFGILMPTFYGFDYVRVRNFMLATFEWMMTRTDGATGYPADGNHLVQGWLWFSLSEPTFEGFPTLNHLFDPVTTVITPLGLEFGAYTAPLTAPLPGSVDLEPVAIHRGPAQPANGSQVTVTVVADIRNAGAETADNVLVRFERDGVQAGEATIPSLAAGATESASVVWSNLAAGQLFQVTARVDPDAQIVECDPFNNSLSIVMGVASWWIYLPSILRE